MQEKEKKGFTNVLQTVNVGISYMPGKLKFMFDYTQRSYFMWICAAIIKLNCQILSVLYELQFYIRGHGNSISTLIFISEK